MKRVTGIGGIFFKADDPKALTAWYRDHLGIVPEPHGSASFPWREKDSDRAGLTVWAAFPHDTD